MSPHRLVGLYPAAWRERYGDEFHALLETRTPGRLDVIDIVWGAVDAHLFPQAPEGRFLMFTRLAGLAAIGAAAALLMGFLFFIPNINELTVPVFYGLATIGVVGIHLRQVAVRPALAWLGFLLGLLGLVSGIGFVLLTRVGVIPTDANEVGFLVGLALWIGSSALGAVMLAIRVFPTLVGLALVIGSNIAVLGLFAAGSPNAGEALDILGQVGILVYAAAWLGIGVSLLVAQPQEGVLGPAT
ncbi:MAG TPA: hypothetical protein VIC63_04235 [Candidatus Limnocylindria bacterium]